MKNEENGSKVAASPYTSRYEKIVTTKITVFTRSTTFFSTKKIPTKTDGIMGKKHHFGAIFGLKIVEVNFLIENNYFLPTSIVFQNSSIVFSTS